MGRLSEDLGSLRSAVSKQGLQLPRTRNVRSRAAQAEFLPAHPAQTQGAQAVGGLTAAAARGEAARVQWVKDGLVVPGEQLAQAWGLTRQALAPASDRCEVFAVKVGNRLYYPQAFLGMDREAVAVICRALGELGATEKLMFWLLEHGALSGKSVIAALESGIAVAKVERLAAAWARERGAACGVAKSAAKTGRNASAQLVKSVGPKKPLPKLKDRELVNVDLDNLDEIMEGMTSRATYRVNNELSAEGGEFVVNLVFDKLDDFRPGAVVQQVEPLRKLLEARTKLADLRDKMAGNEKLEDILGDMLTDAAKLEKVGRGMKKDRGQTNIAPTIASKAQAVATVTESVLLDRIVDHRKGTRSDIERVRTKDIISELVREVLSGTVVMSDNLSATLDARVAEIDALISQQLSLVMHHPDFQKLEFTWAAAKLTKNAASAA